MHPTFPKPDIRTGELLVDPEVELKARGFDLQISMYYGTGADVFTEWGYGRSASVSGYLMQLDGPIATITRGDFSQQYFQLVESEEKVLTYVSSENTGNQTTLSFDVEANEYTEHFLSGMQIVYGMFSEDFRYQIARVVDPSGNTQSYSYDQGSSKAFLESIELPGGRLVTLNYNGSGDDRLVRSVQDWSGRRWTLAYDAESCLASMMTPLGCITKYAYSHAGSGGTNTLVHTIEDPRGYVTTYLYNDGRRVTYMASGPGVWTYSYEQYQTVEYWPSGGRVTYNFDDTGNLASMVSAGGVISTYEYNTNRIKVKETTQAGTIYSVAYDVKNRLIASDDPLGNRTEFQYDNFDNLTTVIAADGGITTYIYQGDGSTRLRTVQKDPIGRVTTFSFTGEGLLRAVTDPRGLITTNSYDTWGNVASVMYSDGGIVVNAYDSLGRLVSQLDQLSRCTSYTYDAGDHVLTVENPLNQVTSYVYDGCLLQAEVNPLNQRTTYTYGRFNKRLTVKNALGFVTTTAYDNMGYPVTTMDANGNITSTQYDAAKRVEATIDALGFRTSYFYDSAGRQYQVEDALNHITESVYNARDLIATINPLNKRTSYFYDDVGRQVAVEDARNFRTTTMYDLAGQVTTTIDALSYATTYAYNLAGGQVRVTDPLNISTETVYFTNSNRVQAEIDALGYRTTYLYDAAGQLTSRKDPRDFFITFTYDLAGRQTVIANELNFKTTTTYDAAGRPATVQYAKGNRETLVFDAVGQQLQSVFSDTRVTFAYDPVGNRTTMQDQSGVTTYAYSARSEVTRVTWALLPVVSRYDAVGNRVSMTDPNGDVTHYHYDAADRLTQQTLPAGERYTLQYDDTSNNTTMLYAVGSQVCTFDGLGRVLTQIEYIGANPVSTIVDAYDAGGRKISQTRDGGTAQYVYDNKSQLTGQLKSGARATYSYDPNGNQLVKHHEGGSAMTMMYDAANRLTTAQDGATRVTFTFDNNGNMTREERPASDYQYTYLGNNLLLSASDPSVTDLVKYDGDGLRRVTKVSGAITSFVWDGSDYLGEVK